MLSGECSGQFGSSSASSGVGQQQSPCRGHQNAVSPVQCLASNASAWASSVAAARRSDSGLVGLLTSGPCVEAQAVRAAEPNGVHAVGGHVDPGQCDRERIDVVEKPPAVVRVAAASAHSTD